MAAEPSRLEALRRRVQQDPASFAFAALAEEYRRAGQLAEAVAVCRKGLERHSSYSAARVTLARALTAMGDTGTAAAEFEEVLKVAPGNLAARRGLAEIQRERGDLDGALATFRLAVALAPQDQDLAQCVATLESELASRAPAPSHGTSAPTDESPSIPSSEPDVVGAIAPDPPGDESPAHAEAQAGSLDGHPDEGDAISTSEHNARSHDLLWLEAPGTSAIDPVLWSNEWDFPIAAEAHAGSAGLLPADAGADVQDLGAAVVRCVPPGESDAVGSRVELARGNVSSSARAGADPGPGLDAGALAREGEAPSLSLVETSGTEDRDDFDLPLLPAGSTAPASHASDGQEPSDAINPNRNPAANLRIVEPPAEDAPLIDIDLPVDPRLDALESFLDAVVRSKNARG